MERSLESFGVSLLDSLDSEMVIFILLGVKTIHNQHDWNVSYLPLMMKDS